ncbi:MAG: NupC/NupG family nucleoside CNT transporter [Limisphaerales bacterium]
MLNLLSLFGLAFFLSIAWMISEHRKRFPWRTVLSGVGLQIFLGFIILRTEFGNKVFAGAQIFAQKLLSFADQGTAMVFGPLANQSLMAEKVGQGGFVFAIVVTGTIILVASISALLYHYGILQKVVQGMAWVMRRVMGVSGSESLAAAANVFMGQTEAPLVVKPYLKLMTRSEMLCLMTGGMSTIAGGVFAVYVGMGIDPGHLLTASIMSAPAALLIAKIMIPEVEVSQTAGGATLSIEKDCTNGLDAMCKGASDGLKLSMNVLAMLIAFTAAVALVNYIYELFQAGVAYVLICAEFGKEFHGAHFELQPATLQTVLGYANAPFAYIMGIPWSDCVTVGQAMGERIVLNEFMGYLTLSGEAKNLDSRSLIIGTYALCGFANFASIAIQIGGISAICPERRADLAKLGFRSMIGGVLASYTTACVAGMLI